jgi:hypothetical protein
MDVIDIGSFYGINCLPSGPNLEVTRQYSLLYGDCVILCSAWHDVGVGLGVSSI